MGPTTPQPGTDRLPARLRAQLGARLHDRMWLRQLVGELLRFGTVGLGGAAVDVTLFNIARNAGIGPLTSKAISTTIAATLSYFANRHWSFSHRARSGLGRELPLFIGLSAIGLAIAETCLAISHYGLGYHSTLADNVSANGIGLVLGTMWRFWSFKRWVFRPEPLHNDELLATAVV